MTAIIEDASFWVAVGFLIFLAAVGKLAWGRITAGLDDRAETIRHNIEEARQLREEAQAALARYQRQHRDAVAEAEAILETAREEASRLRAEAEQRLEQTLARRQALAMERIAQAEAQALREVREQTVDVAIAATARLIGEAADDEVRAGILNRAIEELPVRLR